MLKGEEERRKEEAEEEGGGVGLDDKRWLGVTSGGNILKFPILVTSSGNIMNQLVYVANHNKTFESHVQVSSFIWENPNTFLYFPYIEMKSILLWSIVS